jgi:hypothetical protein
MEAKPGCWALRDGVRAGVPVLDDTEGGGVGLLRRPLVRDLKAPKRAEEEERLSGVRGTSPDDGDISLSGRAAGALFRTGRERVAERKRPDHEDVHTGGAIAREQS